MSKKHFNAIAKTLAEAVSVATPKEKPIVEQICLNLASTLGTFNPNFDRGRFLAACGVH